MPMVMRHLSRAGRGDGSQSREAKKARRDLAWKAYKLRAIDGRSIRDIAVELGVSKSTVGCRLPRLDGSHQAGRDPQVG
jgi:AcrR family transcriptional regulator